MPVKEIYDNKTALFVCPNCGKEFVADYQIIGDDSFDDIIKEVYEKQICKECEKKRQEEALNAERDRFMARSAEMRQRLSETLKNRLCASNIPKRFQEMEKPFVRHTAEWIYRNHENSLLISGETGTGKTSSACFVAAWMLKNAFISVKYTTRQEFFAEYVQAKTSKFDSEAAFLDRINKLDLLIIDELIGRKGDAKLSESSQEMLFNLIDGVYAQSRDTRIWIIGNFYLGSVENLVEHPEPMIRRINESFKIAWFDGKGVDENMKLESSGNHV